MGKGTNRLMGEIKKTDSMTPTSVHQFFEGMKKVLGDGKVRKRGEHKDCG